MLLGSFPSPNPTRVIRAPCKGSEVIFYPIEDLVGVVVFENKGKNEKVWQGGPCVGAHNHPRLSASGQTPTQRGPNDRRGADLNPPSPLGANRMEMKMKEDRVPSARTQELVTAELHHALQYLIGVHRVPVAEVFAIMHAEIVTQIGCMFGGKIAAECCESAARRIGEMHPRSEFDSAMAGAVLQ